MLHKLTLVAKCLCKNPSSYNVILLSKKYLAVYSAATLTRLTNVNQRNFCNVSRKRFLKFFSSSSLDLDAYEINVELLNVDIKNKKAYLVDVRERQEIKESGQLPNAINIPLDELQAALQLNENNFKVRYGTLPPNDDGSNLVFSCRSGRRSYQALMLAHSMGYINAKHLKGGYLAWTERFSR